MLEVQLHARGISKCGSICIQLPEQRPANLIRTKVGCTCMCAHSIITVQVHLHAMTCTDELGGGTEVTSDGPLIRLNCTSNCKSLSEFARTSIYYNY